MLVFAFCLILGIFAFILEVNYIFVLLDTNIVIRKSIQGTSIVHTLHFHFHRTKT